jgi:CheY-like chemotaxis protein
MSKPKILLVESSTIVLQIEKRCLKDAGVIIFTAASCDEALRVARKVRPDLVYLAYNLAGTDGAACCAVLKSDPELAGVPVVMVCSAAGEESELCRSAGCDAIVAKPVDRREFLETGLSFMLKKPRDGDRIPCRATVACFMGDASFYGTIENVSANGMYVGSAWPVAAGDVIVMKFVLPWSGATLIEAAAQVAWVNGSKRQRNNHVPPGFGVFFLDLKADQAEQISDFLELSRLRLAR